MKWDIRMPHIQKNTTRLMMRMLGISLILAFAGFPITHPDTISAWTDFRFAEFCKDSSSYDEFFTILKEDLEGNRPINLADIDHRRVILEYAQLRNAWVKSGNLSNFRMAVVITKALCQLLGAEALAVFEGEEGSFGP